MANWIKCSERMPEKEGTYLLLPTVTIKDKVYGDPAVGEYVLDLSACDEFIFPNCHHSAFIESDQEGGINEILASYWMEMPEMPEGVKML